MKQILVTTIDTGDGCERYTEELPPGGKWLTREQVQQAVRLWDIYVDYANDPIGGLYEQQAKEAKAEFNAYMDELFGGRT